MENLAPEIIERRPGGGGYRASAAVWAGLGALVSIALAGLLPTRVGPVAAWCAQFLSGTGNALAIALGYGALLVYLLRRRAWGEMGVVLATVVLETVAVHLQKLAFYNSLPRPLGTPGGFPSGHAAAACALAFLVALYWPRWAVAAYALAVAISWSRLATHAHYAYQVLAGAMTGYLVALLLTEGRAQRAGYHRLVRAGRVALVLAIPLVALLGAGPRLAEGLPALGSAAVLALGGLAVVIWARRLPTAETRPLRVVAYALLLTAIPVAVGLLWLAPLELLACLTVSTLAERERRGND